MRLAHGVNGSWKATNVPVAAARYLFWLLRSNALLSNCAGFTLTRSPRFPSHVLFMGWWRQVRGRGQCPRKTSQPERPGASRIVVEVHDYQTYAIARKIHAGRPRGQCFPTHSSLYPYEAARLVVAPRAAAHARLTRTPARQPEAFVLPLGDGANRSRAANASSLCVDSRQGTTHWPCRSLLPVLATKGRRTTAKNSGACRSATFTAS